MYVEKYTNIDYLEYELDLYNLKDQQRRNKQEDVINKLKQQDQQRQKEEIYEEEGEADPGMYDEMRNQRQGFGANAGKGFGNQETGGLQPHDEDESDDEDVEDDGDEEGIDEDEDDEEASDHNF